MKVLTRSLYAAAVNVIDCEAFGVSAVKRFGGSKPSSCIYCVDCDSSDMVAMVAMVEARGDAGAGEAG